MKLSIVVPCRNAAQTIDVQLQALSRQICPGVCEVIVAVNGSTDGTQAIVERYFGRDVAQATAVYMEYQSKGWIV